MMGKTIYTIDKDSVVMTFKGRSEAKRDARATSSGEWNSLMKALEEVDLKKISSLEAPSSNRSTDASPFGKVFLTTKDTTFKSKTFDGYHPHSTLQPLLDAIKKITKKN